MNTGDSQVPWALVDIKQNASELLSDVFDSGGSGSDNRLPEGSSASSGSSPVSGSDGTRTGSADRQAVSENSSDIPTVVTFSENGFSSNPADQQFDPSKYCYHKLRDHEKLVYSQIYTMILQRMPEGILSSLDEDEIDKCFNCVMTDNPDFFYLDGYRMTKTTLDGKTKSISLAPRYTMDEDEILKMEDRIDDYVNRFVSSMPDCPDEYSRAKYLFDYLIDNTEYDSSSKNNQNICSVFAENKSVCQGYSMAAKYLCDELGIFCTTVYGEAGGESHAWNIMRLDGIYCHVDVTWGDTSYHNSAENRNEAMKDYVFLGASDEIIYKNHRVSHIVPPPICTSLSSYYFVRTGTYFTEPDVGKLDDAFDNAYAAGDKLLTIRCSDRAVYDGFDDFLFSKGNVFEFLKDRNKARYVRNPEELTISFVLN